MKQKHILKVVKNVRLAKETVELTFKNEYITNHAKPGQFIYIYLPHHTLRRPISIAWVNREMNTFAILFKIVGEGTRTLACYEKHANLECIGPNGKGYPINQLEAGDTALLIGGGVGIPPLYYLAQTLKERNINIQIVLGFQSKSSVFYEEDFKSIGETIVVTDDGSYEKKGLVTNWLDRFRTANNYFSCGPLPMLKAVKAELNDMIGYLSFEERMGCGIGACYACFIPTNDEAGYKRICCEGPVFRAEEVNI